jgi:hypothetical protein
MVRNYGIIDYFLMRLQNTPSLFADILQSSLQAEGLQRESFQYWDDACVH